ncbi:MAG: hypothetical protein RI947_509 [Candidatus Parcubacteria bacterium]|jgi:hypothetical protein
MVQYVIRLIFVLMLFLLSTSSAHAAGTTYYIDCAGGNDTNAGSTQTTAWKTLGKANTATLQPGDALLLKRGCIWSGRLTAKWKGTQAAPITIGAYGSGNMPAIQTDSSTSSSRVEISGNYQIIENLDIKTIGAKTDPGCKNQTIGYFVGFNFTGSSSYNILRNSKSSYHTIGVHITDNSHHNKILNNEIFMNSVMNHLTPDSSPDLGAWGMDLKGDDNEIAYNYFHDNNGWCAYDFSIKPGNAIEIYNADRSYIHHNKVVNDRVFSEVGHDGTHTSDDNIWAYNSYYSTTPTSRFLVLHGPDNAFGPVLRSKIYNNSVYLPGVNSTGIGGGDAATTVKNNILIATSHITNTGVYTQTNNIFWSPNGTPLVNKLGTSDKKADPQYVNPGSGDLHIKSTSPAINAGVNSGLNITSDLEGNKVPNGAYDIGAYEYGSAPTGPSSTPGAITSPTPSTPVTICSLAATGDANCDNLIDLTDFEIWRKEYLGILSSKLSDFNKDGVIGITEFEIWRTGYFVEKPAFR